MGISGSSRDTGGQVGASRSQPAAIPWTKLRHTVTASAQLWVLYYPEWSLASILDPFSTWALPAEDQETSEGLVVAGGHLPSPPALLPGYQEHQQHLPRPKGPYTHSYTPLHKVTHGHIQSHGPKHRHNDTCSHMLHKCAHTDTGTQLHNHTHNHTAFKT